MLKKMTLFVLFLFSAWPASDSALSQAITFRPVIRGTHGVVAGGNHLAVEAGYRILHKGGNAIDAGAATVLAASVIEFSHFAFGGEVPVLIRYGREPVVVINGQGTAPKLATLGFFQKRAQQKDTVESATTMPQANPGMIPSVGPLAATVPAVLDAMIVALERFGTMTLEEVLSPSVELADGFPLNETLVRSIERRKKTIEQWHPASEIFLRGGKVPEVGTLFAQRDLARTLRELITVERKNAGQGRVRALEAVRDYFYRGPIARRISDYMEKNGGLLRFEDLAQFRARIEQPAAIAYRGLEVFKAGFFTQGPSFLEALNMLENFDLRNMKLNSAEYIHTITEVLKLAFADRDAYYGDPDFVNIPTKTLLAKSYAKERIKLIDPGRASLERRPGLETGRVTELKDPSSAPPLPEVQANDTTCVNVIDGNGNMFSATPSGGWLPAVVAGDTGILLSQRMQSFLTIPGHPNVVAPGKRPRITLTPTIVLRDGKPFLALSTPGGDNQDQSLLQVFLNIVEFGMNPQQAVEAPRLETRHLINSFDGHEFKSGLLLVEKRVPSDVIERLSSLGHKVEVQNDWGALSAPTVIMFDPKNRVISAGADVRGTRYALGW